MIMIYLLLAGIVGYWAIKYIRKSMIDEVKKLFVQVREKEDAFSKHNDEVLELTEKLTKKKVKVLDEIDSLKAAIKLHLKEKEELETAEGLNKKEESRILKLDEMIKKKKEEILNHEANTEIKSLEKELDILKEKGKHIVKVDLFDFNVTQKYFLSKHAQKLVKQAKEAAQKGLGCIIIHTSSGEKIYFMKFKKFMIIEGGTYFHNPAKVRNSWFNVPVLHFDEGDPEPKDMGNTMHYPMSAEELTSLIYDQKLPDQKESGFMISRYLIWGLAAAAAAWWLWSVYSGDSSTAASAGKAAADAVINTTTVVK